MFTNILQTLDIFAMAFAFGATVWFFFIQSPTLLKRMGRERFVPVQMGLTRALFSALTVSLIIMLGAAALHNDVLLAAPIITAALALGGALVNTFIVLPRALRAGGRGLREVRGRDSEGSLEGFVSEGVGNATQFWHRAVVLFVVVMLVGIAGHGYLLVTV